MIERRIDRTKKAMKGDKSLATELALLERVKATLEEGLPARSIEYTDDEMAIMKEISLISMKPSYLCRKRCGGRFLKRYRKQRICKQS